MNALTLNTNNNTTNLTMSSREIAELTGKRHDNVKRTIETLVERGVISLPQIEEVKIQRERRVETVTAYRLAKRDTYVLVAQLSPEFTAALVDRWQELEKQQAKPAIPQNFAEALRLAAEIEEHRQTLLLENEAMKPKAESYDTFISSEGLYTTTQAASILGYRSAQALNAVLRTLGWKHQDKDMATAYALENGYLTGRARTRADNGRSFAQVYITPKGLDAVKALSPAAA